MNSALPDVRPTDREEYIASKMLRAAWLEHVHKIAEHAWGTRRPFTIFPFDGMAVDAAAKELHLHLDCEAADRVDEPASEPAGVLT